MRTRQWAARAFRAASLFLIILSAGCADILPDMPEIPTEESWPADAIVVPADEGYHTLPARAAAFQANVIEGDFAYVVADGEIYMEENNEGSPRICRIVCGADTLTYVQKPTRSDMPQQKMFYRHMAIGYSYNGLEGDYANPSDLRCQIINRAEIDRLSNGQLLTYNRFANVLNHTSARYTSLTDYVHATTFHAEGGVGIQTLGAKVKGTYGAFEEGITNSLILTDKTSISCAEYYLQWADLQEWLKEYPSMLTSSFRAAYQNLTDVRSIDRFIRMYGTHVVTYAMLGASLEIEVQVETTRFVDSYHTDFESNLLLGLFNQHTSSSVINQTYQIAENSRCRLRALGGDPRKLSKALDLTTYSNEGLNADMVNEWIGSVKMDDDDIPGSNARLVEFEMVPIWEFIPDDNIAELVKGRILGDAERMAETYGKNNFVDTSFDLEAEPGHFYHGSMEMYVPHVPTMLITAANRYVAMICEEMVPEIDPDNTVRVAYPIYEGHPDITEGLCIHQGKAYRTGWIADTFIAEEIGPVSSTRIWLNKGKLSTEKYSNISYSQSASHPDMVFQQDLQPDGSIYQGYGYCVIKMLGDFYLIDTDGYIPVGALLGVPGWEYRKDQPAGASRYRTIRWEWEDSMLDIESFVPGWRRRNDYLYYYMPSIIRPK